MSYPDADWLRAVIQQTVREMLPEIIQAMDDQLAIKLRDRVVEVPIDRNATLWSLESIGGTPSPPATPDPST